MNTKTMRSDLTGRGHFHILAESVSLEKQTNREGQFARRGETRRALVLSVGSLVGFKSGGAPNARTILSVKSLSHNMGILRISRGWAQATWMGSLWQSTRGKGPATITAGKTIAAKI